MHDSLEARANFVSRDEYERAYTLSVGAEQAKEIVTDMFDDLERNPDHNVALDPKFIALLAMFCDSGRKLAAALMAPEEVRSLQVQLARETDAVRAAFPELAER